MGADIFIIILSLAVLGGIGYLMYKGIKQRTATKKFPVFLVASIVVAIFVGLPAVGMIFYSIDDMANPAPTVTVQTKKVKITGTNSTGILKGKTSPRISVKLYDVDEEATFKTVKSDKNGKFTVTGLEENSTYKVTAKNNGKKSEAVKVTVSDIPAAAYTKLTINNHNDTGDLTIESDSNNQVQVVVNLIQVLKSNLKMLTMITQLLNQLLLGLMVSGLSFWMVQLRKRKRNIVL